MSMSPDETNNHNDSEFETAGVSKRAPATGSGHGSDRRLFTEHQQDICKRTDHMFAVLMALQWVGGIVPLI